MATNKTKAELIEYFLDFSVAITAFPRFDLQGTGQVDSYYDTVNNIIGDQMFEELLTTFHSLDVKANTTGDSEVLNKGIVRDILGSEKFGAIARNIIKLWYVATWYQLPRSWRETFGANEKDIDTVVSPQAYVEGLLWPTLGVNPRAAKAPGYGTWANPPEVDKANSLKGVTSLDSQLLNSKEINSHTKILN